MLFLKQIHTLKMLIAFKLPFCCFALSRKGKSRFSSFPQKKFYNIYTHRERVKKERERERERDRERERERERRIFESVKDIQESEKG